MLAKRNGQGVFSRSAESVEGGFDKNLKKQGNPLPPVNSLKDVGMATVTQQQLSPYKNEFSNSTTATATVNTTFTPFNTTTTSYYYNQLGGLGLGLALYIYI